jgi:beta-lactamase class A
MIPVAVCVLTNGNGDGRGVLDNAARVTIAKIAKAGYDHFAADGGK